MSMISPVQPHESWRQSRGDWSSEHGLEPAALKAVDCEWTWLRTSHSEDCWLWVNIAQNQPFWRLLTMSDHGSEPATLKAADYVWTWLRTSHSERCWLSEHGSEPATLKAADYEWTWLRTSHSEGCCLRVKLRTSVAKFVMPAVCCHFLFSPLPAFFVHMLQWYYVIRLTTCLENLEMSGNLTAVREMSGFYWKSGNCQGKVA